MGVVVRPDGLQRLPRGVPQRGPGVQAAVRARLPRGGEESGERKLQSEDIDQQCQAERDQYLARVRENVTLEDMPPSGGRDSVSQTLRLTHRSPRSTPLFL